MVQTWVAVEDPERMAQVLDYKRLNAQRGNEGVVIARALMAARDGEQRGYQHHPAVRMWMGFERAFMEYEIAMCREWRRRGYQDGCLPEYVDNWRSIPPPTRWPDWYGVHPIHESHRIALVSRLPEHYSSVFPDVEYVDPEPPLQWPVGGESQ